MGTLVITNGVEENGSKIPLLSDSIVSVFMCLDVVSKGCIKLFLVYELPAHENFIRDHCLHYGVLGGDSVAPEHSCQGDTKRNCGGNFLERGSGLFIYGAVLGGADEPLFLWDAITLYGGVEVDLHLFQDLMKGIELGVHLHDLDQKTSRCVYIAQDFSHLDYGGHLAIQEPCNVAISDVEADRCYHDTAGRYEQYILTTSGQAILTIDGQ